MKKIKDRVVGSGKVSTIIGTILGTAIAGAAQYYTSGGNTSSWQPYAAAAGVAVVGAMWKGKAQG